MNFPNYVPEGARNHASQFLGCYEASLAKNKLRLIELTTQLAYWQQPGHDPQLSENQLDQLRRQKNVEINHQDTLASDIETIRRLVHDERMKEAYRLLNDAFFEDMDQDRQTKFGRFIYAAWQAHLDFSQYRDRLKRAAFLRDQIADTANNLASQLHKIEKTGVSCPKIFFSIHELLLNTDNNKWNIGLAINNK